MVKTKNPIAMQAADKEDAVLVAVTRDGKTYLGHQPDGAGRSARESEGSADQQAGQDGVTSRPMRGRDTSEWWTWWTICARPAWISLGLLTEADAAGQGQAQPRRQRRQRAVDSSQ